MLSFGVSFTKRYLKFHKSLLILSRKFHGNEARFGLPNPPIISELITEQDAEEARTWATQFVNIKVPKEAVDFSFSRSSGPGGQNVNKVNTKATLRCPVNASWIPRWAMPDVVKNSHYVASTHSILITSTVHRSQSQNIDECLQKLHSLIFTSASRYIKSAPSDGQKKKVEALVKAEKSRRKVEKIRRSGIKQARSGRGGGFDF
ncbi:hypothetical protein BYT27DRAFT_7181021 [Phlegmacium glaucopus]|nr:hypothetical protein BYT27DRAFT_7181021 [Phlegmacium glaucopus]